MVDALDSKSSIFGCGGSSPSWGTILLVKDDLHFLQYPWDGPIKHKVHHMAWIVLVVAGLLEIAWAYYMKQSAGFSKLVPSVVTVVLMLGSFGCLAYAMKTLPLGTSYMIWTGIGAIGAFIVGIIVLGEQASAMRLLAAGLIIAGLALMKFSSPA